MLLSAQSIRAREWIITPFHERTVIHGMSFGLSSCGYDIRSAEDVTLPPRGFRLAFSLEQFAIPHDLCMRIVDKSSWARQGVFVQNTVAEPGWRGYLTLEITNARDFALFIPQGTPIAQVQFELLDASTELPYAGKYQDQPARAVSTIFERAPA